MTTEPLRTDPLRMRCPTSLLLLVLAACAAAPSAADHAEAPRTPGTARSLAAPLVSARQLFDRFLSPTALATSLHRAVDRGERLAGSELRRLERVPAAARRLGDGELTRLQRAPQQLDRALGGERQRLPHATAALQAGLARLERDLGALRRSLGRMVSLLRLDRQAMGEPDDLTHRVDPADDRPVPTWWDRVLRRLLP